ncbi:surface antigen-like protein [Lotmaria passim]
MSLFFRRFFLVALLVAVAAAVVANAECDPHCDSCQLGVCVSCKKGYYRDVNGCVPCYSKHCANCEGLDMCLECEPGYKLVYVSGSGDIHIHMYGKCVSGKSSAGVPAGVPTALVAAAMAVVYAAIA